MWKHEEGITLIELLLTIACIGVIVVTSTLIFTNSVHVGQITDRRNQALNLAEMVMEDLQTYDYSSGLLSPGTHSYSVGGFASTYTVTYTVLDPDPADSGKWDSNGHPLLKELTVDVQWNDGGRTRVVTLATYRAKRTL